MAIQEKPPEEIFAQTAAFADAQPRSWQLTSKIGDMATSLVAGETTEVTVQESRGEVVREFTPDQYVEFLRSADSETRKDIGYLAEKAEAWEGFEENATVALKDATENDPHFLGKGSGGKVYEFEQDGELLAVKTGAVEYSNIRAFRLGEPFPRLAHLKAIDLEGKRSVMNRVPGSLLKEKTLEERLAIPDEHIKELVDTVIAMYKVGDVDTTGLTIDSRASNFLYDIEQGFGVLDYQCIPEDRQNFRAASQILGLKTTLTWGLKEQTDTVQVLNKFLDVLEANFPDLLKQAAAEQAASNTNSRSWNAGFYHVDSLPEDEQSNAFRARLERLGLRGDPDVASDSLAPIDEGGDFF